MSFLQHFDLYSLSQDVDRGGSAVNTPVLVFESGVGVFTSPSAEMINEWFGEGIQVGLILIVRHNLVNNPLDGVSLFNYLDTEEWPFLYIVPRDERSTYYHLPFRMMRVVKAPRSGMDEKFVCALRHTDPQERVVFQGGVLG